MSRPNRSKFHGRAHVPLVLCLSALCAGLQARGDLVLTNFSATNLLKIMAVGDSITDDCSTNGAWRQYLQPLLETNGYPFTFVGRYSSTPSATFTKVQHEGICGAVIAAPGLMTSQVHDYSGSNTYLQLTLMDALTNVTPDLLLVYIGVNDIGRGRDPLLVATNHLPALLDSIFARAPAANVVVTKVTTLRTANVGSPLYSNYSTNIPIFNTAVQRIVNARRALGQNVFVADMFSAVDPATGFLSDHLHPNTIGLTAIARELLSRIDAFTVRTNRAVAYLVPGCSDWRYSDQGLNLGTNWAQVGYDDSAWSQGAGPLGYGTTGTSTAIGYGPVSASKYMTTYFRRGFVVPTTIHCTNLNLRLNRADGAAVWLNGQELFRMNLPANQPLSYLDRATSIAGPDALHAYYETNIAVSFLLPGTNVLAVEVHKVSASAPSLSFDLELFGMGDYPPPGPRLTVAPDGSDVLVRWSASNSEGFVLFSKADISPTTPWVPLGGPYILTNGFYEYRLPLPATAVFYRLQYLGLPPTPPQLGIHMGPDMVLSWGIGFAGFNLETTSALPGTGSWQTVSGPYTLTNWTFQVQTSRSVSSNAFFRLRKPLL
jgi:lysophospholipase L1-like esterase